MTKKQVVTEAAPAATIVQTIRAGLDSATPDKGGYRSTMLDIDGAQGYMFVSLSPQGNHSAQWFNALDQRGNPIFASAISTTGVNSPEKLENFEADYEPYFKPLVKIVNAMNGKVGVSKSTTGNRYSTTKVAFK